ncbi:hypothetical protein [Gimesia maris]|uniref:Uncharacterized protein n=1 Tax=Gimesia maris TaxID=122 RepID=A0ABX5YNP7_9PLAN|nr:hypothetical protein [Gimesia maris]QEG17334.1 hypothetical protein GmarT_32140 [Gimesia maris]QGQ29573.1 hypothetical protein F1729_13435 [Gimesia maris]
MKNKFALPVGDGPQDDDQKNIAGELLATYQFKSDYRPSDEARCMADWLNRAVALRGKSPIRMAMLLTQRSMKLGRTKYLMVTQAMLTEVSISRVSAYEALEALASAGLITVDRRQGRCPMVSILHSCIK